VTTVPLHALADQAQKHLGEDGPLDTCVSNGPERWARELGLLPLGTASVTEARRLAKAGHNGWRYHEGTAGLARGHVGDWDPKALGDPDARHVCVVDDVEGERWRGIGSGTPSGKVARQPASGGFNPKTVLVGYFVPPTETAAAAPAKAPAKGGDYVVQRGDYLLRIAAQHDTTVKAILALNPPLPARRSADYHIAAPNLILVGQRLRLP
jgi:LysM repeat protein